MKQVAELVEDPKVAEALLNATTTDELNSLLQDKGISLEEKDLKEFLDALQSDDDAELDAEALEAVAGGGFGWVALTAGFKVIGYMFKNRDKWPKIPQPPVYYWR